MVNILDKKARWLECYHCDVSWNLDTGEVLITPGTHVHGFKEEPKEFGNKSGKNIFKVFANDLSKEEYNLLMSCKLKE